MYSKYNAALCGCHTNAEHTDTLTTASLYLATSDETTSVLLGVDTEAASHPGIISVVHTDEAQTRLKQLSVALPSVCWKTGEAITGCH